MTSSAIFCAQCGVGNPPQAVGCFACGQSLTVSSSMTGLLSSGSLLKQRYRLLRQMGQGALAPVYAAEDTQLGDRVVAVKEMSQRGLPSWELVPWKGAKSAWEQLLAVKFGWSIIGKQLKEKGLVKEK